MQIIFNDSKKTLAQLTDESNYIFKLRGEFIQKNLQKYSWKDAVKLSKIWANIKWKHCRYHHNIYHQIKQLDSSI